MKKKLFRLITTVLLAFSILVITQMAVNAQDEAKVSLLKNHEGSYIIYVEDALNTEFLFSFSEDAETEEEDLVFSASGLDSNETNIAYMTKEIAESLNNGKTYMWTKVNEKLNSYKIDLNQAITNEKIAFVNKTTKRIAVNANGEESTSENINGVKITHSQGKINITEEGNDFSYNMVKAEEGETKKFVELANKINNSKDLNNYEKATLAREFSDVYIKLFEKVTTWEKVPSNKVILQPQEAKKDDIYLVWIKDNTTGEHDVQILICDASQDIEVEEEKKVTIYETTKLPVTYDSIITLIISLVVIVAIIIALVIIKKKANNNKEN